MFLTCRHHPTQAESFTLAEREHGQPYEMIETFDDRRFMKFLTQHATCGGTFDHFTLSYAEQKDLDLPKPAPVANAVHATLRDAK